MSIRTLVVDDTSLYRILVQDALSKISGVEVVGIAKNGREALEKIQDLKPDLVILDVEMPEMTGIELLKELQKSNLKPGVVMLSSFTVRGGDLTIEALQLGAFDFITKPEAGSSRENQQKLLDALRPIVDSFQKLVLPRSPLKPCPIRHRPRDQGVHEIVVIGVSTGGPQALSRLFSQFTIPPQVPVVVVQHMPPLFTQSLAASLSKRSCFPVKEGEDGEILRPGVGYIAPGGFQMKVVRVGDGVRLIVNQDPPENNCRPSVDYLFRSVSQVYKEKATGVIMTGMGNDGTLGLQLMKRMGAWVIAQDEASCVVFSMPREAIKTGIVDTVVGLDRLGEAIMETLGQ